VPAADSETVIGWAELAALARRHQVTIGGLVLIVAQLIWKGQFLGHFFFRQDDFQILDLARRSSFSWSYLTSDSSGHLFPGAYAVAWVLARVALYNWAVASAVTLVLIAACSLAALRLLRALFGNRPAILIPLAIYLASPLAFPDYSWWISALESLPLQIAIFMSLTAHVHYVRTGRFRHALAAAAWLAFGLLFFEKALVIPLLLFAVTAGFLVDGRLRSAVGASVVRYWRAWLLQAGLLAGYLTVLAVSLRTSSVRPGAPGSLSEVYTFTWGLVKNTLLPGALGGPWQWFPTTDSTYAYSAPPPALSLAASIVAIAVVAGSILTRRRAWRAWVILAGWVVLADMLPVIIGRLRSPGEAAIFAIETRYVADAMAVLVICLGLAFWPVAGRRQQDGGPAGLPGRRQERFGPAKAITAGLVGAFMVGSLWSVQDYQQVTNAGVARAYIANARNAVDEAPGGTVIVDQLVPSSLMLGIFGRNGDTSRVVGAMASPGAARRARWALRPAGTIDKLMAFGPDGRLYLATVTGTVSEPIASRSGCLAPNRGRLVIPFASAAPNWTQTLRVGYLAGRQVSGDLMTVIYGRSVQQLVIRAGLHSAYFAERGGAASVTVQGPAITGLCVGDAEAGILEPSSTGPAIPAVAATSG